MTNLFEVLGSEGLSDKILLLIFAIFGVYYMVSKFYTDYIKFKSLSSEDKIKVILRIVKAEILKYMSDAEVEWKDYEKSGIIKKSQVISKIYEKYPTLADYVDQEWLICQIEKIIEDNMNNMNSVLNKE